MPSILQEIDSTEDLQPSRDPFEKVIGQSKAIELVKSAVLQRRHVLLCGVPGIGKSMIAKAAKSLLEAPKTEIHIEKNPINPERPKVAISKIDYTRQPSQLEAEYDSFLRPEDLPFEIAIKMGFRCSRCKGLSFPDQRICMECGYPKRSSWEHSDSYQGLLRALDVISEPALTKVSTIESIEGSKVHTDYTLNNDLSITVTRRIPQRDKNIDDTGTEITSRILVSADNTRFIRVSGRSPAELLGDVKHDPYGAAEGLAKAPHERVIPGAIHEAHEGILYVDELAALGQYQKHLLTAMQDGYYPIMGNNPHSSGASIRVDGVPCDFILFASCNPEDIEHILSPLRSRIRGYGYEIMLNSFMERTPENECEIVRFAAQTIYEDGRIPHMSVEGLRAIIDIAGDMAYNIDRAKDALTLRLRELGGIIRVAGDFAVKSDKTSITSTHVTEAKEVAFSLDDTIAHSSDITTAKSEPFGDYFL